MSVITNNTPVKKERIPTLDIFITRALYKEKFNGIPISVKPEKIYCSRKSGRLEIIYVMKDLDKPVRLPRVQFKNVAKRTMECVGALTLTTTLALSGLSILKNKGKKPEVTPITNDNIIEETVAIAPQISNVQESLPSPLVTTNELVITTSSLSPRYTLEPPERISDDNIDNLIFGSYYRTINSDGNFTYTYQENYDKMMNNYYSYYVTYGEMYGIDPAILAAMTMQEGGVYDPNASEEYYRIGLGQVNGNIWDGVTVSCYNYNTNTEERYTISATNLYNNPIEQIKCLAIMMQQNARDCSYNLPAMIEEHNKGCGSIATALSNLRRDYPGYSNSEILNLEDPTLIERYVYCPGADPEYLDKILTYLDMILDNNAFGREYVYVRSADGNVYTYNINIERTQTLG